MPPPPLPSRRAVLASSLALGAAPLFARAPAPTRAADACVLVQMTGGPSQLDTFDPKPDAPAEVRGPFGSIPTRLPGVRVSELFPRIAELLPRLALVRTLTHAAPAVHEAGLQLLNAGRLTGAGPARPGLGAVAARAMGGAWVVVPEPPVYCGIAADIGQTAGPWRTGRPERVGAARTTFDERITLALAALERGAVFVTVNFATNLFTGPSFDAHAGFDDLRDRVAPAFDAGFTRLVESLRQSGRLARTLVVAAGEFGRTPKVTGAGGRDHWPACGVTLVAGAATPAGRVIGRSDATASVPADRPVEMADLAATIAQQLALPADAFPGAAVGELISG